MKSGFCVLWGRPNAGKSTLLNALLGRHHAIVSPRPQTTRHRIAGVLNSDESDSEEFQIVFLDTPGIHEPLHRLGEALVKTAKSALSDIECVVFVADATDKPHDDDRRAAEALAKVEAPILLALNKRDAVPDPGTWQSHGDAFKALRPFEATFSVSALKSVGLEDLQQAIVKRLPEGEAYFPPGMMGDRSPEFHIEELIREQALLQLREEIPHSIAVGIEQMEPRANGTLFVAAFVFVERESQKKIVIGEGGARIRDIGKGARGEIEAQLGRKVFLELRVKVREKWRENETWIRRFGYSSE
jgi:GTP-binding protein Era